jgi:hypothetical protein
MKKIDNNVQAVSENPTWTGNGQLSNGDHYSGYTWKNDFGGGNYNANGQRVH